MLSAEVCGSASAFKFEIFGDFRPILAVYATKWQIAHDLRSEMFRFREAKFRLCHFTSSTSLPEGWDGGRT